MKVRPAIANREPDLAQVLSDSVARLDTAASLGAGGLLDDADHVVAITSMVMLIDRVLRDLRQGST